MSLSNSGITCGIFLICFLIIQYLIWKYHKFEFERTRNQSFIFFLIMFLQMFGRFIQVYVTTRSSFHSESRDFCDVDYKTRLPFPN